MTEFELIKKYFQTAQDAPWLNQGIGDDGAVLAAESRELVVVTDTLLEGVHFFAGTAAASIAHKVLAVNLSDLAAMGAEPRWVTLNLTLPNSNEDWLAEFAASFHRLASSHSVLLIGGDTTRGPLSVSVTAGGYLATGQAPLLRSGAAVGDQVYVVGDLGKAALAVMARQNQELADADYAQALDFPQPRVEEGLYLVGRASAAIDVSDGLLADLGHIAASSKVGLCLDGAALARLAPRPDCEAAMAMLGGGDDYALLFTLPAGGAVPEWASCIGKVLSAQTPAITLEGGADWLQAAFKQVQQVPGFQHF